MTSHKIITKGIDEIWKEKIAGSKLMVSFFTPYITSNIAEYVLHPNNKALVNIYTIFKSENFINQSSSIATFKNLLKKGCKLFHVDNLHAKVLIVDDNFVSIGSQNLTSRGKTNKEVNVTFSDKHTVSETKKITAQWIDESVEITNDMLTMMEESVEQKQLDYILENYADETKSEELLNNEPKRILQRILDTIQSSINQSVLSSAFINCTVDLQITKGHPFYSRQIDYYFLRATNKKGNLLIWNVNGSEEQLTDKNRYILLLPDKGKFAWVRINKTRISKFSFIVIKEEIIINIRCSITLKAKWDSDNHNIEISIKQNNCDCTLLFHAWFDIQTISKPRLIEEECIDLQACQKLLKEINRNDQEFFKTIVSNILTPFVYEEKLTTDCDAKEFFSCEYGDRFKLQLVKINGQPILIANTI